MENKNIPVFIFCGGKGTRLKEETEFKPKPMVMIGGKPILWHIMKIYAHFGFNKFVLCLGYKGDYIKNFFLKQKYFTSDFVLNSKTNQVRYLENYEQDDFETTFADTGEETQTGERLLIASKYLKRNQKELMVTYGDGVTDLDINKLLRFHRKQKTIGTITGVHPASKYGLVKIDKRNKRALTFQQYPVLSDYVNGGFMVFNREILGYLRENEAIEDTLSRLIEKKQVSVYEYSGFWKCMDTYKDVEALNKMWKTNPQWKVWK